jgi:Fe-S cluster assembly ATP-binding protein
MPKSGSIILNGTDITACNVTERANLGISYAFQQPIRFKGITVRDMLSLASKKPMTEFQMCQILEKVGLCAKDYLNREINASLSGGEIKRIEIATVFTRNTMLTVFDEPEAGIDLWSFTNLINVFKQLRENLNGSLVIISHQERIIDIADEIIVIADGKMQKSGTKSTLLDSLNLSINGCNKCPKGREVF